MAKARPGFRSRPPDVATAYCLFDIAKDNLAIKTPLAGPAWSLTLSTRAGENFYLITGADAKRPHVRLLIVPQDRLLEEASTGKTLEGEEQSIIVSPSQTGIVAAPRAPARGKASARKLWRSLSKARCESSKAAGTAGRRGVARSPPASGRRQPAAVLSEPPAAAIGHLAPGAPPLTKSNCTHRHCKFQPSAG